MDTLINNNFVDNHLFFTIIFGCYIICISYIIFTYLQSIKHFSQKNNDDFNDDLSDETSNDDFDHENFNDDLSDETSNDDLSDETSNDDLSDETSNDVSEHENF
jgi:hypothetical protein